MFFSCGNMTNVSSSKGLSLLSDTSLRHSANAKVDGGNLDDMLFPTFSFPSAFLLLHSWQAFVYPEPFFLRGKVWVGPLYGHRLQCWIVAGIIMSTLLTISTQIQTIPTSAFHNLYPAGKGPEK
jgi:hypothetical protein